VEPCTRAFGPACLALHYPRRCGGLNPLQALRLYRWSSAYHERLPHYDAILVASSHMYAEYEKNGVSPDRLHLVRLPVTDMPRLPEPQSKTPSGRLLFLGRLTDLKGGDVMLRALPMAQAKLGFELHLTVAGDGAELAPMKELAREMNLAVDFIGWVFGRDEKADLMRRSDLLVMPSLWPEPFGLAGVEAGCVGLPAAGFASGGITDWLIPGETGELAPADPPTAQGLAAAIARALADPDHYRRLSRGAFEWSERFTLERHVAELEPLLAAHAVRDRVAS
jgi:glycosyltransferase involved in cell wall biosynthesis